MFRENMMASLLRSLKYQQQRIFSPTSQMKWNTQNILLTGLSFYIS